MKLDINFGRILSGIEMDNAVNIAIYMTMALFLSVVLTGLLVDRQYKNNAFIKWFSGSLTANIVMLVAESALCFFDGNIETVALTKTCAIISYCSGYLMAGFFAFCLVEFICETAKKISRVYAYAVFSFLAAFSLFVIFGISFEFITYFDRTGTMQYSPYYNFINAANLLVFFSEIVFVFCHKNVLGKKVYTLSTLGALTIVSTPLLLIWDTAPLYIAVSLSLVIMNNIFRNEVSMLAYRDSMTGLLNTASYKKWVSEFQKEFNRSDAGFGVIVFDINYLKETNDNFGHDTGNKLIYNVAQIISGVFKRSTVFRIGGDEFVVVLKDRDLNNYKSLVESIDERCRTEYIEVEGKKINISVARGVAFYDKETDKSFMDVFNRADDAMYENKRAIKACSKI